jgi:hypothetical protein
LEASGDFCRCMRLRNLGVPDDMVRGAFLLEESRGRVIMMRVNMEVGFLSNKFESSV